MENQTEETATKIEMAAGRGSGGIGFSGFGVYMAYRKCHVFGTPSPKPSGCRL